jgi:hypothetical protein
VGGGSRVHDRVGGNPYSACVTACEWQVLAGGCADLHGGIAAGHVIRAVDGVEIDVDMSLGDLSSLILGVCRARACTHECYLRIFLTQPPSQSLLPVASSCSFPVCTGETDTPYICMCAWWGRDES